MSYYEKISCRIAIQVCVGHSPNGRKKHRTFSMMGIDPNASTKGIAAVIRALAPALAYPITKVTKVTKREIIFYEDAVMPIPQDNAEQTPEARRVIAFPLPGRLAARKAGGIGRRILNLRFAEFLHQASRSLSILTRMPPLLSAKQAYFISKRAPPGERPAGHEYHPIWNSNQFSAPGTSRTLRRHRPRRLS